MHVQQILNMYSYMLRMLKKEFLVDCYNYLSSRVTRLSVHTHNTHTQLGVGATKMAALTFMVCETIMMHLLAQVAKATAGLYE